MTNILPILLSLVFQTNPATDEILRVLDNQATAWNRGDIAGYMDGYWKSDSLVFTSGGTVNRGWRETFEKYAAKYDTREKMGTLQFSDVDVTILSAHSAWVLGRWELQRADQRPYGIFTIVMKQFPNGWKIIHDHTSVASEP